MAINVMNDAMVLGVSRNLWNHNKNLGLYAKRMATGLRINSAADGAADLSLSEKLKSRIQASEILQNNAKTGINALNTADGDLGTITTMLQRMRNLSVQGLNGVYSTEEKKMIMDEIDALGTEIKRITMSSKFSDKSIFYNAENDPLNIFVTDRGTDNYIDLSSLSDDMLFADVLAKDADVYMLNMNPGQTYHVEFNNKLYQITNSSSTAKNLIYSFKEDLADENNSIQFIQDSQDVTTSFEGPYENTQIQMGNGELYQTIAGGQTNYFNVGNEVFSLSNTDASNQTAVFETTGTAINMVSGANVTAAHQFTLSNPTLATGNETAITLNGSEQKYINYAGKLYSLTNNSASEETFVFRNNSGNLQALSGNVTSTAVGTPSTPTNLNATNKYVKLSAGQELYYTDGGNSYTIKNTTGQYQLLELNNVNNIVNGSASVTRTLVNTTNGSISMTNPYAIDAIAGQKYYIKSTDNSQMFELTASATGKLLIDFDGTNINGVGGVGASVVTTSSPDFETVTPDGSNQFLLDFGANSEKTITIGSEIYKISNAGSPKAGELFDYDSVGKTISENIDNPQITVDGYLGNLSSPTALSANDYYLSSLASGGTTFMQIGGDVFKINNSSGSATDSILSYNAVSHTLTSGTGGITASLEPQASFTNNAAGDRSLSIGAGVTRIVQFGSDNFEITNNTGSTQNAVFTYSAGNLNMIDANIASYFTITKHVADNTGMTNLAAQDRYTTMNAGETKYFAVNGDYYSSTNTSGTRTVVLRDGGTTLNQLAGTGVNSTHISNITTATTSTASDYYIEMSPNDQQYIKVGSFAYSIDNTTASQKTDVFRQFAGSLITQNSSITETNIPISNLGDFTQMLPIVDWALDKVIHKRSFIGSKITALDQTIEMNTSAQIQLTSAYSKIADADIAKENANYLRTSILRDMSAILLKQAKNMHSDTVLKLLS